MDLIDIINEKRFLAQEFLTWLWFKTDTCGGFMNASPSMDAEITFGNKMILESGEGDAHEEVSCKGRLMTKLHEARKGLAMGKKVEQANIHLIFGEYECKFLFKSSLFEFKSFKVPKIMGDAGGYDNDEIAGMLIDRLGIITKVHDIMVNLLHEFGKIRCSDDWPRELDAMRRWVAQGA